MAHHRVAAALAALAVTLLATPAATADAARSAPRPASSAVSTVTNPDAAGATRKWWTVPRIKEALSHPLDTAPAPTGPVGIPPKAPATPPVPLTAPGVKPKKSAVQSIGIDANSVSRRIKYNGAWPNVTVGKLLFKGGHCSASIIVAKNANTLWTAGHCLYDRVAKKWRTDFAFIPGYKDGRMPWGVWEYATGAVPSEYINSGDVRWSDVGALVLRKHPMYGRIQDNLGALGYRFDGNTDHASVQSTGYPASGYHRANSDFAGGEFMMYCLGSTSDASRYNPRDNRIRMSCDMGGGASGGPMVENWPRDPRIIGANSHRNSRNGAYTDINLYSSEHTVMARNVYAAIQSR